ncbi:small ribosomal subunit protein uS11m-like [Physella acuta]|uniref:small ribosomal subunit protein uS11m-like n=1 Tax=Physella acuta TaxID=109671 RepID=UPI0027DE6D63|nr:small ribosomal subunit protein uS11m-like [Physella acuta]
MLKSLLQIFPLKCAVKEQINLLCVQHRSISTKSIDCTSLKYNRFAESIRQQVTHKNVQAAQDSTPVDIEKNYGSSSFPTLATHSQLFDGIKYLDLPIINVKTTSNNTVISLTNGDGIVLAIQSAGTVGFRNAKKGTNVAAQAAAIALAGDAIKKEVTSVRVCIRGIGAGRLPALKALHLSGLNIVSITDTTRLPHNGNRPKKARRL